MTLASDLPVRSNIKTIRHWFHFVFMMLLCQVLQTPWFKWWRSLIVNSHRATVDHTALDTRRRSGGSSGTRCWWCKTRLLEVVSEFLLRWCCLSCLQMLFEVQTDVKTSQELLHIRSVTSKLSSLTGKNYMLIQMSNATKKRRKLSESVRVSLFKY